MKVSTSNLQNAFGKYLQVALDGREVVITKNGKSVAKLERLSDDFIREEQEAYIASNHMTYEEFLLYSEESDFRCEYIDGQVYLLASPSFEHQEVQMKLSISLHQFLNDKKCNVYTAPLDITLSKYNVPEDMNVVQPDIMIICDRDNVKKGKYMGVPELVVEILSPSTRSKDMLKKLDLYCHSGIKEYWMVDLKKAQILVYTFENQDIVNLGSFHQDQVLESVAFKGLNIDMKELFE